MHFSPPQEVLWRGFLFIFAGMKRLCVIGIVILLAFVACTHSAKVPEPVEGPTAKLSIIDSLMWQRPDSALLVLMEYEGDSNVFNGHYAQLLTSELLFKNDYAQTNRTELLQAVVYFDSLVRQTPPLQRGEGGFKTISTQNNDFTFLAARAHYINGAGYYERDSLVEACTEYLCALRTMESHFTENELVEKKARFLALTYGRLVDFFMNQLMPEPTIVCAKHALAYYRIAPTSKYGASKLYNTLGVQFDILKESDSAAHYYEKALETLPDRNTIAYRDIISSWALFHHNRFGHTQMALDSLKSMAAKAANETERITRYMTIGVIYVDIEQYDTAKFYLEPVLEKDPDRAMIAAKSLKDIALNEGDTLKANEYSIILSDVGASAADNQFLVSKLNDLFQNYLQEKQEVASLHERRKAVRLTLMVLVPLLVAIGLAVAIVMRRRHRKRLAAQEAEAQQRLEEERQSHRMEQAALSGRLKRSNETLRELQDQVRQQNDTAPKPETSAASFAEEPICRLIMERVNEGQFKSQMDCTVYKDYALGKEQVTALREAADRHFNQFTSRLAKAYPDLTRGDLDYCCLYLLGLSDADIAALMQKAYPTISQRARKMKGIFGSEEPVSVVLRGFANESIS